MYAINRKNKLPIVATVERIHGHASLESDGFERDAETGAINHAHGDGGTKMFWDSSETMTENGHTLYVDDDGNEVTADQVDLVDELPTPEAGNDLHASGV